MARVKNGFLGDLAGSVGNVTFSRARGGIQTARVRSAPSNPRTTAQQTQRGRFRQIQLFASAFLAAGLVRPFWRPFAIGGLSAYNAFMRANAAAMPDAFDPAQAVVAQGNGLAEVALNAVAPSATPNAYDLTLESPMGGADTDLLVGAIYHAGLWQVVLSDLGDPRVGEKVEVAVPAAWVAEEDALFAYGFAYQRSPSGLILSGGTVLKVNANPYALPDPGVPAAETTEETYG